MRVDIYRDQALDRILIVEDGKEIPRISGEGSSFLKGLAFQRKIDFEELPIGLKTDKVLSSLTERGFYAGRQTVTVTEVEIQD